MKEAIRPAIYRMMKYWGKKPHNIWSYYIKKYCPKNGIVVDPFVGSGMTYFESIKNHRVPITIDINPISDLCIKCVTMRNYDKNKLLKISEEIINEVKDTACYQREYVIKCSFCGKTTEIYNYKKNGEITISYKCKHCNNTITDINLNKEINNYIIDKWIPDKKLSDISSISDNFISNVKSDSISSIWTNRNLYLLSEIYDRILNIDDMNVKMLMVFAFIQCLHLTSIMCIPRSEKSNRPLSTSWGRPAYMNSKKIFEQNPVLAFEKAIKNSTGIIKGMESSKEYLGSVLDDSGKHNLGDAIENLSKINDESVDLVITDPPYGNIIQYGDLSEVWVSWLEKYNSKYIINHEKEIIINNNKNNEFYEEKLSNVFKQLYRILKNDGNFILTFNSKKKSDWDSLILSLKKSKFGIEKIILQKNRRSSEANVRAKEGISICDYYIFCKKNTEIKSEMLDYINEMEA